MMGPARSRRAPPSSAASPSAIDVPHGLWASFPLAETGISLGVAREAGDDPDAIRGATVPARLHPAPPGAGVRFRMGPGVSTFTLSGLFLAVGGPAINSGPRAIVADEYGLSADSGDEAFRQDGGPTSQGHRRHRRRT